MYQLKTPLSSSTPKREGVICPCCGQISQELLLLDYGRFTVTYKDQTIRLIGQEFDIFSILWRHRSSVVSVDSIICDLYGMQNDPPKDPARVVYTRVYSMRRQLEKIGVNILSIHGRGYIIELK